MAGPRRIGIRNLRRALVAAHGNMAAAARKLGLARSTVWEKVRTNPDLQKLCEEILEEEIDEHEEALRKLAIEKEQAVPILAFLNNRARHRQWGRPADEVLPVQGQTHYHLHFHSDKFRDVADDQLGQMLEARRAELAVEDETPMITVDPKRD